MNGHFCRRDATCNVIFFYRICKRVVYLSIKVEKVSYNSQLRYCDIKTDYSKNNNWRRTAAIGLSKLTTPVLTTKFLSSSIDLKLAMLRDDSHNLCHRK